jgi:lactococcin 972 family bacteriocin
VAALISGAVMALGMLAVAAPAEAQSAGGGSWYYGQTLTTGWSQYYHPTKTHSATACVYDTSCGRATVNRGWDVKVTKFGLWGRKAYWNTY